MAAGPSPAAFIPASVFPNASVRVLDVMHCRNAPGLRIVTVLQTQAISHA